MRLDELFNMPLNEDGKIVQGVNTTQDVKLGEIPRQAKKFGNRVDDGGHPPVLRTNGTFEKPSNSK
jgi:hypothetical protein